MSTSKKPKENRLFTKRITVVILLWAMGSATYALIYQPDLYAPAMTWIVPLMLGIVGFYQGIGHADLKTILKNQTDQEDQTPPSGFGG